MSPLSLPTADRVRIVAADAARLGALRACALLDTPADPQFDRVTRLAARALGAPIALVSLVDAERVFFKSSIGLPAPLEAAREAPLAHALCPYVVAVGAPVVVDDARTHPTFTGSEAAARAGIVAYLGVPILTADRHALGSVCVIDAVPREWTLADVETLCDVADSVLVELERREASHALTQSEERYRSLFRQSPQPMWVYDCETLRFLAVNDAAVAHYGYAREEFLAMTVRDIRPEADRPRFMALQDAMPRERRNMGEWRHLRRDGSVIEVEVHTHSLSFDGRAARQALVVDVTHRRELDRLKREFIATVSHEFRTPLTAIRGALGLVHGGALGAVPAPVLELMRVADANAKRLARLVSDVVDVEAVQGSDAALAFAPTSPRHLLHAAVASACTTDAEVDRVRMRVDDDGDFCGDADRLTQALAKLLGNALKFSAAPLEVELRALRVPGHARFEVIDRGPGVPAEQLGDLFHPFRQLDAGDDRAHNGSGLGLTLARAIVERHGGRIGADSPAGGPTTFWFEVPAGA